MSDSREIYLDNAATTRPHPAVVEAMLRALTEDYGNPSSLHRRGVAAERILSDAREAVAHSLRVSPSEIVFTSGGTEANVLAIRGVAELSRRHHLVTTATEHSSVLETFRALAQRGLEITELPVDHEGRVTAEQVNRAMRKDTALVSIMAVNNELGTIQPLEDIARVIRQRRSEGPPVFFHVDAVQAWGKLPLTPGQMAVDLLSLSGHKVHGPKGVGVLYVRKGVPLAPILWGGDQERQLRPGTENVAGIAGLGAAARLLDEDLGEISAHLAALKSRLVQQILELPDVQVNSPRTNAAPHILNVTFPGVRGETLLHRLEMDGIMVSTGSACHSHTATPSHVLLALGLSPAQASSSLRFSLSRFSTREEVDAAASALRRALPELRALAR
jgi:cysteine desulfurase